MSENLTLIKVGYVVSIDDKTDGGRIQARIFPDDNILQNNELPWASPYNPKMLHVVPKVGEAVLIVEAQTKSKTTPRYYVGPIISQPNHMYFDSAIGEATSLYNGTTLSPETAEHMNPPTRGCYPEKDDIALMGRKDSEVILKDDSLEMRCGVRLPSAGNKRVIRFNEKHPSYVKLDYNNDETGKTYRSTATVVADKINLIGNNSKDHYDTTHLNKDKLRQELISDEELNRFIEKAHQIPFGDELVSFLKKLVDAYITHTHPFPTLPPCSTEKELELMGYDYDNMLSDTVRIN